MLRGELKKIVKSDLFLFFMVLINLINICGLFVIRNWEPISSRFESYSHYSFFMIDNLSVIICLFFTYLAIKNTGEEYQFGTVKHFLGFLNKRYHWLLLKLSSISLILCLVLVTQVFVLMLVGVIFFGLDGSKITFMEVLLLQLTQIPKYLFFILLGIVVAISTKSSTTALLIELPILFSWTVLQSITPAILKKYSEFMFIYHLEPRYFIKNSHLHVDSAIGFDFFNYPLSFSYMVIVLITVFMVGTMVLNRQEI